jgi:hypothetical protein
MGCKGEKERSWGSEVTTYSMPPKMASENPMLDNLFRAIRPGGQDPLLRSGNLVTFIYQFWKNDPAPLLLVTDVTMGVRVRGLNLHYLTFPVLKNLLRSAAGNPITYQQIKGEQFIVNCFREFKWTGIRQIKKLDVNFLLTTMAVARSFDPNQIDAIRKSVREQLMRPTNQPATRLTGNTVSTPIPVQPVPTVQTVPTTPTI